MSCKHCDRRLEEMDRLCSDFWYAFDHFGKLADFCDYRDRYISHIDLEEYCWACKNWFPVRLRNTLDYERRKRK